MDVEELSQVWKVEMSEYNYADTLCEVVMLKAGLFLG